MPSIIVIAATGEWVFDIGHWRKRTGHVSLLDLFLSTLAFYNTSNTWSNISG